MLQAQPLADVAHLEGIARGSDGELYGADEGGRVFRIDQAGAGATHVATIPGWGLGLACDARGRLFVCTTGPERITRVDPVSGTCETWCETAAGAPMICPNYPVFGADGTLYVSDSGPDVLGAAGGRILAVPPGGGDAAVIADGLNFANGVALAADGTLYVIESYDTPGVVCLKGDVRRRHAELPGTVPDGLALCDDGALLVSCFQPNRIYRVPPGGGEAEVVLDDWRGLTVLTPTNVAFYGPGLTRLAIASLCGWRVCTAETPWSGQPLHYPETR